MNGPRSLKRTVGLGGAVLLGLGSILGTGVFVSLGLAVDVAGAWAIPALVIASLLATFNALSSAQLAANHPVSGGTYAYGYRYLSPIFGFTAGLCFLLAKSASAAAASLGIIGYAARSFGFEGLPINILAAGVVILMTGLTALGLKRAGAVNTLLVSVTLAALFILIAAVFMSPDIARRDLTLSDFSVPHIFEAAALLFVAFTGYGRIATLGEEVKHPRKTIPRAITATLLVSTVLYFAVLYSGLVVLGPDGFAAATLATAAPLETVAAALSRPAIALCVSIGAFTAMAGVLLNLILGLSRVALAMGREGDLPRGLAKLSGKDEPIAAVWLVGLFIAAIALTGGLSDIWSFSAFTVLVYYAITNFSALKLAETERLYPRIISVLGLFGCLGLSLWVDIKVMMLGVLIIFSSVIIRTAIKRPERP